MKVRFYIGIGLGEGRSDVMDLPDGLSCEEIEAEYLEWRAGFLDGHWYIVEDGGDSDD